MSRSHHARRPRPVRAGEGSNDAPIGLASFNGLGAASSVFGDEPQELLGLAAGPQPTTFAPSMSGSFSNSSGPGPQFYTNDIPSDNSFPQDLDLSDPHGSRQAWKRYKVNNNNGIEADPLHRLASAEPEQSPWNPIHLHGIPPCQPSEEHRREVPSSSVNVAIGRQRSITGSHANETDEGYFTYSQPDLRSTYSGDSVQMHRVRPGLSSTPRTLPSAARQAGYAHLDSIGSQDYEIEAMQQRKSDQVQAQEPLRCTEPGCSSICKTRSDLKKHNARHKREHVCNQPGCKRAQKGFATVNDLERHQKTVHGIQPSHGSSQVYRCFSPNCKHLDKEWPRLDNFKQHLLRMHKLEAPDELIQKSKDWYEKEKKRQEPALISARGATSPSPHLLNSSSSQPGEASERCQQYQNYLYPNWQPTANLGRLQQPGSCGRPRHSSFSGQPNSNPRAFALAAPLLRPFQSLDVRLYAGHQPGESSTGAVPAQLSSDIHVDDSHQLPRGRYTAAYTLPNPDTSDLSDLPDPSFSSPYSEAFTTDPNDLAQIASNFASEQPIHQPPSDPELQSPSTNADPSQRSLRPSPFSLEEVQALIDSKTKNAPILKEIVWVGFEKLVESQQRSAPAPNTSAPSALDPSARISRPDATVSSLPYRCPEGGCAKMYARPCDLKKHLKRHERPYGCTFSKCYEKFGSKYDWKRHESIQHFQVECWKCGLCPGSMARDRKGSTPSTSSYRARLFYSRDLYEGHLRTEHSASEDTVREHVSKQRIGRGCQSRFWCGFCRDIIVLKNKGLEGSKERFNHIDEHFKMGLSISTWVEMDESATKGQQDGEEEAFVQGGLGEDGTGGGVMGKREDDEGEDAHEGDATAATVRVDDGGDGGSGDGADADGRTGQKRVHSSDADHPSSPSEPRPRHRRRTNPVRERSSDEGVVFVHCCRCSDGPWVLEQSENCAMCSHRCCRSCDYERRYEESWV